MFILVEFDTEEDGNVKVLTITTTSPLTEIAAEEAVPEEEEDSSNDNGDDNEDPNPNPPPEEPEPGEIIPAPPFG